ncbi:hypothetical protein NEIRO03_0127 [Nematocida sp. AWRm78]|nr:hypothetical protein NEIRO02_0060 [Nematocida sp. AWRm79]KAI5182443.1 hypothetical protein NEIRO03_0127 [Nematocida sp. AWRm78]
MDQKDYMENQNETTKNVLEFVMRTIKQSIDSENISKDTLDKTVHFNILKIQNYIAQNISTTKAPMLDMLLYNILLSYRRIIKKKISIASIIKKQNTDITYLITNLKDKLNEMPIEKSKMLSAPANEHKSKSGSNPEDSEAASSKVERHTHSGKRMNYPKTITKILKTWLSKHIDNPYPDEVEKKYLIYKTGLGNTQINNWFINARRRILPKLFQKQQSVEKYA